MSRRGQMTVETAILLTVIVAAYFFMSPYLQRSTQGYVKDNASSVGRTFSSADPWTLTTKTTQTTVETPTTVTTNQDQTSKFNQTQVGR